MKARERLVASTRELLWERGYVGTSPQAIQRLAGAGQGSMYHHFDGKHGLALAAVTAAAHEMRTQAAAVLDHPGPPLERVIGYLRAERAALRGCPVGRLAHDPDVVADDELRELVADFFSWLLDALTDLLTQARDAGDLTSAVAPSALAATAVATVQGAYVLARAAQDPTPMTEAIDGLVALLAPDAPQGGR